MNIEMDRTKLYGLTHNAANGKPLTRQVRMLKVGIGYTKGPAIHVFIDRSGQWIVEEGVKPPTRKAFTSLPEAKKYYAERRRIMQADMDKYRGGKEHSQWERRFPGKFPYFTFLRTGMDGSYWPDFEAIERHRSMPDEIEIVFLTNSPLEQSMQWWTAAELKCEGNGINALRRLDLARGSEELKLAAQAKENGEKFFAIMDGCYARGCQYASGERPVCKPHSRLNFQLAYNPMLGGTAVFDTTGWRSGSNLFSCLEQIRTITGRGNPDEGVVAGIPLRLVLRPYRTSHNGQPSTQYGVSLQLRAEDAAALMRKTIGQADEFRNILGASGEPLMLEAGEERLTEAAEGQAMTAEFYSEGSSDDGEWDEYGQTEVVPESAPAESRFKAPQRKAKEGGAARETESQPVDAAGTGTGTDGNAAQQDEEIPEIVKQMWAAASKGSQSRAEQFAVLQHDCLEIVGNEAAFFDVLARHGMKSGADKVSPEVWKAAILDLVRMMQRVASEPGPVE